MNSSNRKIARIHYVSKSTVATYVAGAGAEICGIDTLEKLNNIDDEKLKEIIFPHVTQSPKNIKLILIGFTKNSHGKM